MTMRVAIIGGGCCGLTAIKTCTEAGLQPVCFERTGDICGLWRFTEDVIEGKGSVAKSTIIKTSKEMTAFSDFPPPPEFPVYMHQEYVCTYFRMYADKFDLKKYIRFKSEIERVSKSEDFVETGRWKLTIKDTTTGVSTEETFDAVVVCTGHHAYKHYAKFPGMEKFKGEIVHTHDYKYSAPYKNKKAIVVGVGNSGIDAAVDLSHVTSPVYLSTRRGAWVQRNIGPKGVPGDFVTTTRWNSYLESILPQSWTDSANERRVNQTFDHTLYSVKPKHRISGQHPSMNDDLPLRLASGSVKMKPNIKRFTESHVEFEDGSIVTNVDVVVLATSWLLVGASKNIKTILTRPLTFGYDYGYPFIDKDVVDVQENVLDFYLYEFLPDLEKQTMAFIGCIQPTGAIMPIAELQCRYAMQVFKGEKTLPSPANMWADIKRRRSAMRGRYVNTQRHTIQVDYITFIDEMASKVGCKPNILRYLVTNPVFAMKLIFGPCTAYQYRLRGPNSWEGAKKAIENQWERTEKATMVKDPPAVERQGWGMPGLYTMAGVILLAVLIRVFYWNLQGTYIILNLCQYCILTVSKIPARRMVYYHFYQHPMMAAVNCNDYLSTILISICITCALCYEPNWNSLDTRKNPEWYDEGKIGIFLHWGVYSVPGNMVWFWYYWKGQKLPEFVQFMKDHYPPNFQYADFAPQFRAEFFDADEWAKIFKDAGAR